MDYLKLDDFKLIYEIEQHKHLYGSNKSTRIAKQIDKHRMRTAETQAGRQVTKQIQSCQLFKKPWSDQYFATHAATHVGGSNIRELELIWRCTHVVLCILFVGPKVCLLWGLLEMDNIGYILWSKDI